MLKLKDALLYEKNHNKNQKYNQINQHEKKHHTKICETQIKHSLEDIKITIT